MTRTAAAHPEESVTWTTRRRLAAGGALVGPGLLLAGCGGAASSAPSGSATGCGVGPQITVKGSTVSPPPSTLDVRAGCPVSLTITADRTSEVHVHVVDLEKPITAAKPLTIDVPPAQQGESDVELHDPDLLLVKLAVR